MVDCTWVVLCEDARERADGRLDALGVLHELVIDRAPHRLDRMALVAQLEALPGEAATVALDVFRPEEGAVGTCLQATLQFFDDGVRYWTALLGGLWFDVPGDYHVMISRLADGRVLRGATLQVRVCGTVH